ncbi:MAG TPA: sulfite exporter TauE/SafE family protein [Gemmataceae bacterium]|nr:sulfite exporter TauE/SafE family protein [Gemmataceae bacterium]
MAFDGPLFLAALALASFVLSYYGAAVGLILGHLRLPLLIYSLPSAASGAATNLAISGVGALTGSLKHAREGRVSLQVLAIMGLPSVVGALLGAFLVIAIDTVWARLVVGGFLLLSGLNLALGSADEDEQGGLLRGPRLLLEAIIGLGIGFLAAVTGLMLGSLRLPMMIRLLKIDPRVAVGSNMAIGCLTAFAGAATLWTRGGTFHLVPILVVAPPTILGGYLGARWTQRIRKEALRGLVGWTVALTGLGMVAEGLWHVLGS